MQAPSLPRGTAATTRKRSIRWPAGSQTAGGVGLDRQQRRDNLKAAFQVADPARVRDRRLLLVDDVFTTGATIEACATTLLDAGAAAVHVLTLARVV